MGNKTESIQTFTEGVSSLSKGGVSLHSGKKIGESAYKGVSDWSRGDLPCTIFCTISGCL